MDKKSPDRSSSSNFVIVIASIAAVAGILFGFDTGVISGAILFIQSVYVLTPVMNGFVVAAVLILAPSSSSRRRILPGKNVQI